MSDVAKIENLEEFIIEIKGQKVLLDQMSLLFMGLKQKELMRQ